MSCRYFERHIAGCLSELERNAHLRKLNCVQGVNLCSNDYLGLATDSRLRSAIIQSLDSGDRVGSTGSRLLSGHAAVWERLECEFAAFAGTESALFFNSGFAANTGLLQALLGHNDLVFSDALNHASIIDGIRLSRAQKVIYPHCDMNALETALRQCSYREGGKAIVTESLFSMGGDRAPLGEIFQLAEKYGVDVIVDEAHATGTLGPCGRGLVAEHGLEKRCLAVVHTCGKALASPGAFVCGSQVLIQLLVNSSRSFIFSTALPPYIGAQVRTALQLAAAMDQERAHLSSLASTLRLRLAGLGYNCGASDSHIVPFMAGSNHAALELATALQNHGYAVKAIRSPSVPPGTERLRISLTASLTAEDVENFADEMASLSALDMMYG